MMIHHGVQIKVGNGSMGVQCIMLILMLMVSTNLSHLDIISRQRQNRPQDNVSLQQLCIFILAELGLSLVSIPLWPPFAHKKLRGNSLKGSRSSQIQSQQFLGNFGMSDHQTSRNPHPSAGTVRPVESPFQAIDELWAAPHPRFAEGRLQFPTAQRG